MPVQYTNRKGQTFYLHQGITTTGKPKYFFSMKSDGALVDKVPDGFEIYQNPNAQVFLRKIQPKIITDAEVTLVEKGLRQFARLQNCRIDVKKNTITIFQADQDLDDLAKILDFAPKAKEFDTKNFLAKVLYYSPMLQFVLIDEENRVFVTKRFCFLGSIDDWIEIGKRDKLQNLVKYVKHLGQDSFYDLC